VGQFETVGRTLRPGEAKPFDSRLAASHHAPGLSSIIKLDEDVAVAVGWILSTNFVVLGHRFALILEGRQSVGGLDVDYFEGHSDLTLAVDCMDSDYPFGQAFSLGPDCPGTSGRKCVGNVVRFIGIERQFRDPSLPEYLGEPRRLDQSVSRREAPVDRHASGSHERFRSPVCLIRQKLPGTGIPTINDSIDDLAGARFPNLKRRLGHGRRSIVR
jgi:hypothetical protein